MRATVQHYWSLVIGARTWFGFAVALFLCGFALGVVKGLEKPETVEERLRHIVSGAPVKGGPVADFKFILGRNLLAAYGTMCGSLVLALPAMFFGVSVGFEHGLLAVYSKDSPLFWSFLNLFPHGIIELPAFLLCTTFSLRLGLRWLLQRRGTDRKRVFLTDLADACKIGLLCIPLFFVAAVIESFVTPRIVGLFYEEVQPSASGDAGFGPTVFVAQRPGAPELRRWAALVHDQP